MTMPEVLTTEQPEPATIKSEYDSQQLAQFLKVYYRLLFPDKLFYRWLSYGNGMFANLFVPCFYLFRPFFSGQKLLLKS